MRQADEPGLINLAASGPANVGFIRIVAPAVADGRLHLMWSENNKLMRVVFAARSLFGGMILTPAVNKFIL